MPPPSTSRRPWTTMFLVVSYVVVAVVSSPSSSSSTTSTSALSSSSSPQASSSSWSRRWPSLGGIPYGVESHDERRSTIPMHGRRRRLRWGFRPTTTSASLSVVWGIGHGGGIAGSSPSSSPPSPSSSSSSEGDHDDAIRRLIERHGGNASSSSDAGTGYDAVLLSSTTSIDDALRMANAHARLLICYISRGIGGEMNDASDDVVPRLLSSDMVKLANRDPFGKKRDRTRSGGKGGEKEEKKKKKNETTTKKKKKKKDKKHGGEGSYYIWITDDDDHVDAAARRLRAKPVPTRGKGPPSSSSSSSAAAAGTSKSRSKTKSSSRDVVRSQPPILAIICPSASTTEGGTPRIVPRTLVQHHCHPPPSSSSSMSSWANAARGRHLVEYARLRKVRDELRLLHERNEGYAASVRDDAAREIAENMRLDNERRLLEEERCRILMLEERRAGLLANLNDEPPPGISEGVVTIALRFADDDRNDSGDVVARTYGRDELKRRFVAGETTMNDVFDWIDAKFGYERERVMLCTMNGSRRFVYVTVDDDDEGDRDEDGATGDAVGEGGDGEGMEGKENDRKNLTLEEAGLGKLIALRVTTIAKSASAAKDD